MLGSYSDIKDWYNELTDEKKMIFWQGVSQYLNDYELKKCMSEVRKGKEDLFEIHYKHGFLDKYQIYFHQVMNKIDHMGDDYGRDY